MLDTLCTYPLSSDLFTQSIHPHSPLVALGLASGHVQLNRLPASASEHAPPQNGYGTIETAWRTRRHKGSCRALAFAPDGSNVYSAGTDGIVKLASTETGQVAAKIAVPLKSQKPDIPTLLHPFSPSTLLLATDSGALQIYDVRATTVSSKPAQSHKAIHDDYVTSLCSIPSKPSTSDPTQFLSTGSATVAITDIRKGILVQSEDQDEELLSSIICAGKAVVGGEKGVLRFWDVGRWDDSETTLAVGGKGAGADVLASIDDNETLGGGTVAVGCEDGSVRFVNMPGGKGRPKVVGEGIVHDEIEGVVGLGWVSDGRLVSGGGTTVKIWEERKEVDEASEDDDEGEVRQNGVDSEDSGDGSNSSEDEPPRKRRKKKKRGKGKSKDQKGVLKFKGLD